MVLVRLARQKREFLFASPIGLAMLGLARAPLAPPLVVLFQELPNLSVFVGTGLPLDKLLPLFRH